MVQEFENSPVCVQHTGRHETQDRTKDGEVRPEGCICELCSDISQNWQDIRTKFGYNKLSEIARSPYRRVYKALLNLKYNKGVKNGN